MTATEVRNGLVGAKGTDNPPCDGLTVVEDPTGVGVAVVFVVAAEVAPVVVAVAGSPVVDAAVVVAAETGDGAIATGPATVSVAADTGFSDVELIVAATGAGVIDTNGEVRSPKVSSAGVPDGLTCATPRG